MKKVILLALVAAAAAFPAQYNFEAAKHSHESYFSEEYPWLDKDKHFGLGNTFQVPQYIAYQFHYLQQLGYTPAQVSEYFLQHGYPTYVVQYLRYQYEARSDKKYFQAPYSMYQYYLQQRILQEVQEYINQQNYLQHLSFAPDQVYSGPLPFQSQQVKFYTQKGFHSFDIKPHVWEPITIPTLTYEHLNWFDSYNPSGIELSYFGGKRSSYFYPSLRQGLQYNWFGKYLNKDRYFDNQKYGSQYGRYHNRYIGPYISSYYPYDISPSRWGYEPSYEQSSRSYVGDFMDKGENQENSSDDADDHPLETSKVNVEEKGKHESNSDKDHALERSEIEDKGENEVNTDEDHLSDTSEVDVESKSEHEENSDEDCSSETSEVEGKSKDEVNTGEDHTSKVESKSEDEENSDEDHTSDTSEVEGKGADEDNSDEDHSLEKSEVDEESKGENVFKFILDLDISGKYHPMETSEVDGKGENEEKTEEYHSLKTSEDDYEDDYDNDYNELDEW